MQNPNEDTEWNDILRSHGILPEKPKDLTEEIEAAADEVVERAHANRLQGKSLHELDELQDDMLEDDDFINSYREQRIAQLREMASNLRFGSVYTISKQEYTKEITEASKQNGVVVHIQGRGVPQSRLLSGLFLRLAGKFKDVKFVEIDCYQINERYSLTQTPTILVYKNGSLVDQQVTLKTMGMENTNLNDFEAYLVRVGLVERTDSRLACNADSDSD